MGCFDFFFYNVPAREGELKSRLERLGCTRAEGGEQERWLNECASNRRALALLSFQPCHCKTKRPRFSFSALTPAHSLVLSLPPSPCSRSFSEHRRRDAHFRTQPANQRRTLFLSSAGHTHTNIQRERERERENMQQDVSVGQREKGVYEHKHRYEETR